MQSTKQRIEFLCPTLQYAVLPLSSVMLIMSTNVWIVSWCKWLSFQCVLCNCLPACFRCWSRIIWWLLLWHWSSSSTWLLTSACHVSTLSLWLQWMLTVVAVVIHTHLQHGFIATKPCHWWFVTRLASYVCNYIINMFVMFDAFCRVLKFILMNCVSVKLYCVNWLFVYKVAEILERASIWWGYMKLVVRPALNILCSRASWYKSLSSLACLTYHFYCYKCSGLTYLFSKHLTIDS